MVLAHIETEPVQAKTTTRVVLVVEYNGARYCGFQLQANDNTIQAELEKALHNLTGENIRIIGASRTDTGVHAAGQVVSFRTASSLSDDVFVRGLNYYLPDDIAVREARRASDSFHVQRHAVSREYSYYMYNSPARSPLRDAFALHVPEPLDVGPMDRACQCLIGEHNFIAFASQLEPHKKNTVRKVYKAGVSRDGESVVFNIIASSFLSHQVRNTVGSLLRVGTGRMSVDEFRSIMDQRQPGMAGPTVPARGLCLCRVNYPDSIEESKR